MTLGKVIHGSTWLPFRKRKDYGRLLWAIPLNSRGQRVHMQLQIYKTKQKPHPQLYLQIHFKSAL